MPSSSSARKIERGGSWGERTTRGKEVPLKCRYKIVVPTRCKVTDWVNCITSRLSYLYTIYLYLDRH